MSRINFVPTTYFLFAKLATDQRTPLKEQERSDFDNNNQNLHVYDSDMTKRARTHVTSRYAAYAPGYSRSLRQQFYYVT